MADFHTLMKPVTVPPQGWTVAPEDLDVELYWKDSECPGREMLSKYGLTSAQPEMCAKEDGVVTMYMFSSHGDRYVWNIVEESLWKIKNEGDAQEIADKIGQDGFSSLETEGVEEGAGGGEDDE
ncbi:hypothetical protein F4777DRAFT_294456 [Nemania sp. FL0916]|nr:hypothetical protein F4777DRAFT_294456 [Nemania sp. FL0916]